MRTCLQAAAANMPEDHGVSSSTGVGVSAGGHTFTVPGDTFVGDPMPDPNGTPVFPQPEQMNVTPGPSPHIQIHDASAGMKFGMADGSMPMKGKWDDGINLDDTEL